MNEDSKNIAEQCLCIFVMYTCLIVLASLYFPQLKPWFLASLVTLVLLSAALFIIHKNRS